MLKTRSTIQTGCISYLGTDVIPDDILVECNSGRLAGCVLYKSTKYIIVLVHPIISGPFVLDENYNCGDGLFQELPPGRKVITENVEVNDG